jgi:hypothetical protein
LKRLGHERSLTHPVAVNDPSGPPAIG